MIIAEAGWGMTGALRYAMATGRRGLAGAFAAAVAVGALVGFDALRSGWAALLAGLAVGQDSTAVISIGDIWYVLFEGCGVFMPGDGAAFALPVSWMLSQMLWAAAVASHDLGRRFSAADRALVRGISLRVWTAVQCAWSAVVVAVVYLGLMAGAVLGGVFGIAIDCSGTVAAMMFSVSVHGFPAMLTGAFVVVSIASSALVACVQTLLLRVCSPVVSLAVAFAYLCMAFMVSSPVVLGGASMACRFFTA